MARRVGIELSASRCALVDLERRGGAVRTFRAIPWSPGNAQAFVATLRLLRRSGIVPAKAVVALWGLPATCHHFSLPAGDDRRLRAQALRELRITGRIGQADTVSAVLVDSVAPRSPGIARDVTVVCAGAAEVRARLAPLLAADFVIEAVVTPAMALASLERLLPGAEDDAVRAYVAVNAEATAVAIVERGLLLHACELALPVPPGCLGSDADPGRRSADTVDFVRCLAPELKRSFLALKQQAKREVQQVVICGELPDLRALTAPLVTSLHVEVATLDGLQGLASGAGATVDADVRDHAGALRVAWAAAVAGSRAVSLLPPAATATGGGRRPFRSLAARAAAVIVLLAGLFVAGRAVWMRAGHDAGAGGPQAAPRVEARQPAPPVAAAKPAVGLPPSRETPTSARPPHRPEARPAIATTRAETPDPVVDSILYGPDRRLALIGHRVVRVGDRVDAGVIQDIEPKAVVVRRPSGELRRVPVKGGSR